TAGSACRFHVVVITEFVDAPVAEPAEVLLELDLLPDPLLHAPSTRHPAPSAANSLIVGRIRPVFLRNMTSSLQRGTRPSPIRFQCGSRCGSLVSEMRFKRA